MTMARGKYLSLEAARKQEWLMALLEGTMTGEPSPKTYLTP